MVFFALRIRHTQDQHVLGQPAFLSSHVRRNAQRKALFAEQRIAAVARAVRPDLARLGVMHDVLGFVARPGHVCLASRKWRAHGVHAGHKFTLHTQHIKHRLAHAGHDFHVDGHVRAVRQFNANVRNRRAEWAHAERHHVHGAAVHAAVEQRIQRGAHLGRVGPVVRRAGVFFFGRANVGAVFHAGYVGWVAAS